MTNRDWRNASNKRVGSYRWRPKPEQLSAEAKGGYGPPHQGGPLLLSSLLLSSLLLSSLLLSSTLLSSLLLSSTLLYSSSNGHTATPRSSSPLHSCELRSSKLVLMLAEKGWITSRDLSKDLEAKKLAERDDSGQPTFGLFPTRTGVVTM